VVPDLVAAHQVLLAHGYSPSLRVATGVIDPQTKVRIDLLPGGGSLTPRCPVNFPMPSELAGVYISLPDLIGVKLGSFRVKPNAACKGQSRCNRG